MYCALPIAALKTYVYGWDGCFIKYYLPCVRALKVCWFLWSYITLMLLAPLVDPFIETVKAERNIAKALPLFVLVFIWSYLAKVPQLTAYVPIDSALVGPALHFLAIYIFARIFAVLELVRYVRNCHLLLSFSVFGLFCWVGFYHMNSPFALGFAVTTFTFFKRMTLPKWVGSVCEVIGPSLFSIYVIHTNGAGFALIHRIENWLFEVANCPYYIGVTIVASVIFFTCLVVDIPRRLLVLFVKRFELRWTDR